MKRATEILHQAKELARSAETWADLSNALFNPTDGLITSTYPSRAARKAFIKTPEYKKIRQLLSKAIESHGLVEGARPKKSRRFGVRP